MKQFALVATITICLLHSAHGQNKTYIGVEFSVANDIYEIADDGDYLIAVPLIGAQGGVNIRQEISRSIFLETGLILKDSQEGFGFKTIPYYSTVSGDPSFIIPLRIGLNLNLYKKKIYLVPVAGYSFGINPPYGYGSGHGTQVSPTTTIHYYVSRSSDVSRYFSLLQTGIGFEFKLFNALLFSISTNYYFGFNETAHVDISYTVNNSNLTRGTAISNGEFWCVSTGLKYPISNFWTKRNL